MTPSREPFDPKLDRLLDKLLAPPPARPELVERIVAATRDELEKIGQPSVIARIGVSRLRRVAAVLILGMEVGIWATIVGITQDARALVSIQRDLTRLNLASTVAAAPIDDQLHLLATQLDLNQRTSDWDSREAALNLSLSDLDLQVTNSDKALTF